jgi:hypothetical protein
MANVADAWATRDVRRRNIRTEQIHHPIYTARELSNEHELLETLIKRAPPVGGLLDYVANMGKEG